MDRETSLYCFPEKARKITFGKYSGNCAIHTDLMFEGYTFTDGTPFGIKEE